jgi:hypothetical protein
MSDFDLNDMVKDENFASSESIQEEISSDENILKLYSNNSPFELSMRIKKFENDSEYNKFIKAVEKMVRASYEYKLWKSYLIDVLGLTSCVITDENLAELTLEVHHHIPSLYIIAKAVLNEAIENDEFFCTYDIAIRVMEIHFKNHIGYAMVCKSMHEKYHNGFLEIPIKNINGNYIEFINHYSRYLDPEDLDNLNSLLQVDESNCNWARNQYQTANG